MITLQSKRIGTSFTAGIGFTPFRPSGVQNPPPDSSGRVRIHPRLLADWFAGVKTKTHRGIGGAGWRISSKERIIFWGETLWLPVEQGAVFQVEFCLS